VEADLESGMGDFSASVGVPTMPMIHNFRPFKAIAAHTALLLYSALALLPVLLIILNSFKDRISIFSQPYAFPTGDTFTLDGYRTLSATARFDLFFVNSFLGHRLLSGSDTFLQLDGSFRSR